MASNKYENDDLSGVDLDINATGNHKDYEDFKIIVCPFEKYEIKIKLTTDNKFLEIIEVKLNKDFLNYKQKMASKGAHDVDKFYRE
jgi:hypothetical protein